MFNFSTYKFKASALQFVIYIVVVVAILLSMLLLYIHLNNRFIAQSNAQIEAIDLSNQGFSKSFENNFSYEDTLEFSYDAQKSLKIKKKHWGVFDVVKSFAQVRDKEFQKVALAGGQTPFVDDLSLYLEDNNQALVVVGNTEIIGKAYLGVYGVKPGQISGVSYTNDKLVYGNVENSRLLPNLNIEKHTYINTIDTQVLQDISNMQAFDIDTTNVLNQSFFEPTAYYFSNQSTSIFGKTLSGNIVIQSTHSIYVDASARLKNVILIAPKINIGQNFKGSLQGFANQSIEAASGAQLNYPSALVLSPSNQFEIDKIPKIQLKSNSTINGIIAYLKGNTPQLDKNTISHISIEERVEVYGQIYCHYNLNLSGDVYGHVITSQFLTPYRGSYYINHLRDVKIQANPVSPEFSGLMFQSKSKNVASWLN